MLSINKLNKNQKVQIENTKNNRYKNNFLPEYLNEIIITEKLIEFTNHYNLGEIIIDDDEDDNFSKLFIINVKEYPYPNKLNKIQKDIFYEIFDYCYHQKIRFYFNDLFIFFEY